MISNIGYVPDVLDLRETSILSRCFLYPLRDIYITMRASVLITAEPRSFSLPDNVKSLIACAYKPAEYW